jgi:tRNA dimethylallyltransferase
MPREFREPRREDRFVSIVGPTGSGKTALALNLFQPQDVLVSLDSVAAYRGLDIGSAKPDSRTHPWIGLDLFDPRTERASAAEFCRSVRTHIQDAIAESRRVVLVGGSHFYESALVDGMASGSASDPSYLMQLEGLSNQELWQRLSALDAEWASRVRETDRYRLCRALDLVERQGLSFRESQSRVGGLAEQNRVVTVVLGMDWDRSTFEAALRKRVLEMLDQGWVEEVKSLIQTGVKPESPALESVGYREIVAHLKGEVSLPETILKVVQSHLQLVKKQKTWIRGRLLSSHNALNGDDPS